ncbi:hypothetical protein L3X38_037516 [Prunus dulcis]|uniref:Retrovirus-related Pol polyprotein from transposon TNT 1-94-like beta-barrel domain-containing protein n=1 Tax=Prunus dulcis TaxID=3755 RepID=A0AAD4V4U1_PRUDU|nr:hypothetical protein L3X38_037516 [Prunus dulcis]
MENNYGCSRFGRNEEDICLADSATTHTILRDKKYFDNLHLSKAKVTTILGSANLIDGFGRAQILLPNGTQFTIDNALYSLRSRRNLLSFKDIQMNGYHIETRNDHNVEYLCTPPSSKHQTCLASTQTSFATDSTSTLPANQWRRKDATSHQSESLSSKPRLTNS